VNAAGVAIYAPLRATPREEHERLFQTNYWGVVNGCLVAARALEAQGGAMITVGSVVSDLGTPILGAYAASKHAAKGFVDSLRIELLAAKVPISVSLILPGGIASPLAEHAANHLGHAAKIPPPVYAPEDVAAAVLYCAVHPRREMVVGGVAALQRLGHALAPHLVDRISTWMIPLLGDRHRPAPMLDNLRSPQNVGHERSPFEPVVLRSAYTAAARHGWSLAAGAVGVGLVLFSLRRRRSPLARRPGA
jgi:short-subunit dehydrogenase